mmetsp:Transcript_32208/g.66383  ORF Transcript_32208/g.66383 Transcript_32208/m.66383 type:complete len:116 (-) Transcript_32208:270-617(-)
MGSAASTPFNTGFAGAAGSIEEHRHGPCRTSEIPPEGVQLSQGAVLVEMEHASASPTCGLQSSRQIELMTCKREALRQAKGSTEALHKKLRSEMACYFAGQPLVPFVSETAEFSF